jgi:hypothetical protein
MSAAASPCGRAGARARCRRCRRGTPVYVSEGIEDGLSVAFADPSLTVVAGVALANMGGLELPPQAGPLVFIGQNDAIDGKAVEAFERAIARQQLAAREAGRPDAPKLFFPQAAIQGLQRSAARKGDGMSDPAAEIAARGAMVARRRPRDAYGRGKRPT